MRGMTEDPDKGRELRWLCILAFAVVLVLLFQEPIIEFIIHLWYHFWKG